MESWDLACGHSLDYGFGTYGFESLRNFFVGWRLNYGTERNDTELFLFFPVCLDLNSRGVASLSKRNPRNAVGVIGFRVVG